MFESLEDRRMLAANGVGGGKGPSAPAPATYVYDLATRTLTINNATSIQVNDYDANDLDRPTAVGDIFVIDKSQPAETFHEFSGVDVLVVNGTKGADYISASFYNPLDATINALEGSDRVTVGNNGDAIVTVLAGSGNDSIFADDLGAGSVTVYGQGGRDTFSWRLGGADFVQ